MKTPAYIDLLAELRRVFACRVCGRAGGYNVVALNAELDRKALELDAQRPPAFTDEALALRFASRHAEDLRYVAALSRWFTYTGTY